MRTCNDSLRPRNRKIRYSLVMSKLLTGLNRISFSLAAEKVSSLERPSKLMMFTCFRRTISSGSWKRSHDSGEFAAVKSHESQRSHIRVYVAIMTREKIISGLIAILTSSEPANVGRTTTLSST